MIAQNRKYSRKLTFLAVSLLSICFVFFTFAQESPEYNVDQLDKPPKVIERILPLYPSSAHNWGIRARVKIRCLVGTDGLATEIKALEADPEEALDLFGPPAVEAVSKWRFRPGEIGGEPVPTRVAFNVVFELPSQDKEDTP